MVAICLAGKEARRLISQRHLVPLASTSCMGATKQAALAGGAQVLKNPFATPWIETWLSVVP